MKVKFKMKKLELIKLILGCISVIGLGDFLLLFKTFFGDVFSFLINIFYIILIVVLIIKLRHCTYKEIVKKILCVILIIFGCNIIDYVFISVRIEPLIYLNVKYNLSYFDMKVIDTSIESNSFSLFDFSKSAIIEYDNMEIYVYYNREWKDDYEDEVNKKEIENGVLRDFDLILKENTDSYEIKNDPMIPEYGYVVFLNNCDEMVVNNVIDSLDDYIINYCNIYNIHIRYSIYIVENSKLYNDVLDAELNLLDSNSNNVLYPIDLFDLIEYKSLRIGYSKKIGQNILDFNNNVIDKKEFNYYKDIIFWYYAEPNSFVGGERPLFYVFAIK